MVTTDLYVDNYNQFLCRMSYNMSTKTLLPKIQYIVCHIVSVFIQQSQQKKLKITTAGSKRWWFVVITGGRINGGFVQENVSDFVRNAKKSGHNQSVVVLTG